MYYVFKFIVFIIGFILVVFVTPNIEYSKIDLSNIQYNSDYDKTVVQSVYLKNEFICKILSYIPRCILYDFNDRGWTFDVVSSSEIINDIGIVRCAGFCDFTELKIWVDNKRYMADLVIWHEFGHYLYDRLNLEEDFIDIYNRIDLNRYVSILGSYSVSSDSELFAESFAYYIYSYIIKGYKELINDPLFSYIDKVYINCENTNLLCFYEKNV